MWIPRPVMPLMPAGAYQTYQVTQAGEGVRASCQDVDCEQWRHGWVTVVDTTTDLGQRQAAYLRAGCGRDFTETGGPGGLVSFAFPPGQRCFREHRVRDQRFVRRDGDWRGNPHRTAPYVHKRPGDWVEDFAEHQDKIITAIERG